MVSEKQQINQIEDQSNENQITELLKNFYQKYITEISKPEIEFQKVDSLKKMFVTSRLLKELQVQEIDYDPFLNAQDSDITWLETLHVSKDTVEESLYHVSYVNDYDHEKIIISLNIRQEEGQFKIDEIK